LQSEGPRKCDRGLAPVCCILLIAGGLHRGDAEPAWTLAPTATVEPAATADGDRRAEPASDPRAAVASPVPYAQIVRDHIAALMGIGLRVEAPRGAARRRYIASTLEGTAISQKRSHSRRGLLGNTSLPEWWVKAAPAEIIVGATRSTAGGPGADDNASGVR